MALRAVKVSLGSGHACALLSDGRVKCWGSNNSGQLGLGDGNDRGDEPGEMGAKLPSVDLGPGRTAKELALTAQATCALLDDGTVKCWGYVRPITGVDLNIGEEPGQMGAALAPLALPGKVKHITAGYQHLCAIFDDGTTRCFGGPADSGELGVGDKVVRLAGAPLVPVNLGAGRTAAKLGPSTVHTCALLDNATVKCWGYGGNGELGSGSIAETLAPGAALDFGAGRTVRDLAVSAQPIVATLPSGYGCVVLDTGSVKCWGFDSAGLGVG
jgi:alpha-tubulin suppressor-like RCC1 family protein